MARMSSGVLLTGAASMACPGPGGGSAPWPTVDWARSTPEEQGMDSARLAAMLDTINDNGIYVDGMVVIRNGYLVLEGYRHPFEVDSLHTIMSCTKSVISALVGIAIAQGSLSGPDQRAAEFFPDWNISVPDHAKRDVTIGNLLTMSGGFEWPGGMRETAAQEMVRSPNWVRFALDRPLRDVPGRTFVYDSGGSHLLSAIVQHATGMPAQSFAKKYLFGPLGITDWSWDSDPQGITQGFRGLALRLRDMAKFGYLYLNHGFWENRQVVPATWVSDSVRKQIDAGSKWMSDGYGYQWWVDNGGYYMALGFCGQYIMVVPERQLVVAAVSSVSPQDTAIPESLLVEYILPASAASGPLAPSPAGVSAVERSVARLAAQDTISLQPLPATALRMAGRTYLRSDTAIGPAPDYMPWDRMTLKCVPGSDVALLVVDGNRIEIGLDGRYRPSRPCPVAPAPPALAECRNMWRGRWTDEDTFVAEHHLLGDFWRLVDTFRFQGNTVTWCRDAASFGFHYQTTGRVG